MKHYVKLALVVALSLIVTAFQVATDSFQLVKASQQMYIITSEGPVSPPTPYIHWDSTWNYSIRHALSGCIVVQRSNVTIEGVMNTVEGDGTGIGFNLSSVHNVTVLNTQTIGFETGFHIHNSTFITVTNNTIKNKNHGVRISHSYHCVVDKNVLKGPEGAAIFIDTANESVVQNNDITGKRGVNTIYVAGWNNIITGNRIESCHPEEDLVFVSGFHNVVSENNITSNTAQYVVTVSGINSTVQLNRIEGNSGLAISTAGNGHNIAGNYIMNNIDGVHCVSSLTTVRDNTLLENHVGLSLLEGQNNTIHNNHISNNSLTGLSILSSPNNSLRNNTIEGNYRNIEVDSEEAEISDFVQNIDASNTVEGGRPICYIVSQANTKVPVESGFVALVNCRNVTVSGLELSKNKLGILMVNTTDSKVASNFIVHNDVGVRLELCSSNNISCNTMIENKATGIQLQRSPSNDISRNNITSMAGGKGITIEALSHNTVISGNVIFGGEDGISFYTSPCHNSTVTGNTISNATNGIRLYPWILSYGNVISENRIQYNTNGISIATYSSSGVAFHNSFVNNSQQSVSASSWRWDGGYPLGGNYWNDYCLMYNATDLKNGPLQNKNGSDGIWDQPYENGITDMYPLVKPYAGPCDIVVSKWLDRNSTDPEELYCISITISITLVNCGLEQEEVDFALQINSTLYQQTFVLPARNSTTWIFVWSITGMPRGNYTVTAQASPVPGETCTDDNCCSERVALTIRGDVDGDFRIGILDVVSITGKYGRSRGDLEYEANCDINNDGYINILDVVLCTSGYGEKYP